MILEGESLKNCVPHQGLMALLTRVVQYDFARNTLASEVDIKDSDLFFDHDRNGVPSWVGFEYMAQSIAALSGIKRRFSLDEEPRIGFIMGVRNFKSRSAVFAPGRRLRVEVRQIFRDGDVASFECRIEENGTEEASAIINAIESGMGPVAVTGGTNG
jgi:predicted hotdog family 3-hydroxylacyl-ACP dehydratase